MEQFKRASRSTVPIRLFSDSEAWNLFRLAAFSEAIGWTLLIAGILIKHFWTPGVDTPVRIAGEIHGTIFLFYLATVVIAAGSMGWSYGKTFVAGLASVPPYGTLILEQILARTRRSQATTALRQISVRAIIIDKNRLLAYQPLDGVQWQLPGGTLGLGESAKTHLAEAVKAQTGVKTTVGELAYIYEDHTTPELMELFFHATGNFRKLAPGKDIDEMRFIDPSAVPDLVPTFLQTAPLNPSKHQKVQFISDMSDKNDPELPN
jgi:integral membrane protein